MKARQALRAAVTADTVDEGLIRTRAAELTPRAAAPTYSGS